MTQLNVPGAVIIPAPSDAKADRHGKITTGAPVADQAAGMRLLLLGFWQTHMTERELARHA